MHSPRILVLLSKRHFSSKMTSPLTWISQSDTWMQVYTDTRKNEDWVISKNKAWAALPSKESFLHSFRKTCSKEYQTCPVWIPTHAARVHTTLKAMSNDKHTGIFLAWLHEMSRIARLQAPPVGPWPTNPILFAPNGFLPFWKSVTPIPTRAISRASRILAAPSLQFSLSNVE